MKRSYCYVVLFFFLVYGMACTNKEDISSEVRTRAVIGMSAAPKTLDPRISTDVSSARIGQLVYNALVKKDESSKLIPDLAETWDRPDDRTYIFHLRKDVFFHNGKRLTARDVKATFDAIMSDTLASPRKGAFEIIDSITVNDEFTITFHTREPFAPFLINMVQGILPASEADKRDPDTKISPIGTGPFKIMDIWQGERIVLQANSSYFLGKPKLDEIEFRFIPDDSIRLMELEKGSIDFLQNNIAPDAVHRIGKDKRFKVLTWTGTSYYYLGFNFRLKGPLQNKKVRRALALALDRKSIIDTLLGGLAQTARSVLPETHWAFDPSLKEMPYDPDTAVKLLDEAGYPLRNGNRFSLIFKCSQNKRSQRLAEVVQAQWGRIGVQVRIRSMEWGTFYDDILHGNFQVYILSWIGITDPDIYYSLFHSGSTPPNGRNRGFYRNPRMDHLLELGRHTLDKNERITVYHKVQQLAAEDLPYINLWHMKNVAVMKKNLVGYKMYPAGDFDSFVRMEWRNEKKND